MRGFRKSSLSTPLAQCDVGALYNTSWQKLDDRRKLTLRLIAVQVSVAIQVSKGLDPIEARRQTPRRFQRSPVNYLIFVTS